MSHCSVKVIAIRKGCAVSETVYWYNLVPQDDCSEVTAPANAIYRYPVRVRGVDCCPRRLYRTSEVQCRRCDSQFGIGIVTKVLSGQAVEVDGTPHHIKDIRHRTSLIPKCQSEPETRRDKSAEEMLLYLPGRKQLTERGQAARPTTSSPPHEVPDAGQALEPQETGPYQSTRIHRSRHCPACD
ncbi:hypothetical protein M514_02850 [Trichuris suis]|uniref:Uncharacterized protein n=1 Tax=Trichuris suis TaxID=68888 RepID=A0A085MGP9_9BILA|nr:hypothetical protein M513_02850 [Trichuris suis]KFD67961.1 hypothetical protein M514_02850 [Trichuris suis]